MNVPLVLLERKEIARLLRRGSTELHSLFPPIPTLAIVCNILHINLLMLMCNKLLPMWHLTSHLLLHYPKTLDPRNESSTFDVLLKDKVPFSLRNSRNC
ncbi:hypothetical protein OSB04_016550 [Centaurea solstitialis]|uniref:Uncharacterized protein n=1 Tax=Centaurea solstitialis TaxID=347529 RepID=A0AA38TD19_9ASTR|nr:hypothetical protein OSB04_016550 [Centaurea solstitialis]